MSKFKEVVYIDCKFDDKLVCELKDENHTIIGVVEGSSLFTHGGFHTSVYRGYRDILKIDVIKLGEETAVVEVKPKGTISILSSYYYKK